MTQLLLNVYLVVLSSREYLFVTSQMRNTMEEKVKPSDNESHKNFAVALGCGIFLLLLIGGFIALTIHLFREENASPPKVFRQPDNTSNRKDKNEHHNITTESPITHQQLLRQYIPQTTPEATYKMELQLLTRGLYCCDLPIFDPEWRKRGRSISHSSRNTYTGKMFNKPFKIYIEAAHAIIYYPKGKQLGPSFLYKTDSGWILDRACVYENIRYGKQWFAVDGDYPYLRLLNKVFNLEPGKTSRGVSVYRVKY